MFTDKKIFILGMARSGYEAAKMLVKRGNQVLINDKDINQNKEHVEELKNLGVEVILGEHPDDLFYSDYDYLIKNPGIKNNHPYVLKALEYKIPVINEVEMACLLFPKDVTIIGITGSNGKTTTTTITYEIIKASGRCVHLTGNIGYPVSSFVDKLKSDDIVVMEVSVQQLCNFDKFKTNISVLINLYEAHLDLVGSYDNYMMLKKRIFNGHTKDDYAILNMDSSDIMNLTSDIDSTKGFFSTTKEDIDGCYIKDGYIYYFDEKIIALNDIRIKGMHNYENIMASIMVAKKLNIDNKYIIGVLESFGGVEHRIEYVTTVNKRDIYNDSKSTNVKATQIALSSFDKPTILLLGGLDRGHSFEDLTSFLGYTKMIIGYGETKTRIKDYADGINIKCEITNTLEEATKMAYELSSEGDVILLSPACASWDQFKDFEERGRLFKEYVSKLEKEGNYNGTN